MEMLNKVKAWAGALADVGVSLAALAIVLEVLGMGNMPFMPAGLSVVDNVSAMIPAHAFTLLSISITKYLLLVWLQR